MSLKDFALDPTTGDMLLADSSFHFVEGAQAVVQKVAMTFAIFRGEWFLDLSYGVPYRTEILVKNPDLDRISSLLRKTLMGIEEIIEIRKFNLEFNPQQRELQVDFEALTSEGIITVEDAPIPMQPWGYVIHFNT